MIPTTWKAGSVQANGINLYYHRTSGDEPNLGNKPVLICAHGITDNGLCWLRLALALEEQFDLILVDARGHGHSDVPDEGYGAIDHAADLVGLAQALNLEKPHFLGHSMGAATLSALAANYPNLPGKVILEDPPWFPKRTGDELVAFNKARRAGMEERRARMAEYQQQSEAQIIADGQETNPKWDAMEFGPWSLAKRQVSQNAMGFKMPVHWSDEVPQYACDTLLITADADSGGLVSPAIAAETQALNPLVSHVNIGDAGHNIRRDQFDLYRDAVVSFLMT